MSELNRERIIRGLACCKGSYDCFTCDIYKRGCAGFREGLARDALSLINELVEENERLKDTISRLGKNNDELARVLPLAKKEIEVETRADTVREMQERLTREFDRMHKSNFLTVEVRQWIIDQIAKEMLEGKG